MKLMHTGPDSANDTGYVIYNTATGEYYTGRSPQWSHRLIRALIYSSKNHLDETIANWKETDGIDTLVIKSVAVSVLD